ncbi:hypothetical protein IQ06DRAFT_343958 [Phaeosphaeriaceae sp. SRC1lsM3a]|nr:hypothetical protein IQ06DRAFT_343958 [Stagonospora sp. SRC1lsM3a]
MADYDSDNDSHAGDPVLLGVTGDSCGTCSSTTIPLYDLSCHNSDDFYCRDCLSKSWYTASDEVIRCPSCGEDCGFMPLNPIEAFGGISRNFIEYEAVDKIREQEEVQNNLIAFTEKEAIAFLVHTYNYYLDQILDPEELGSLSSFMIDYSKNTLQESLANNAFYCALVAEVMTTPKVVSIPAQLELYLLGVINTVTVNLTKGRYSNEIIDDNVDINDNDAVLWEATHTYKDINNIYDNWVGILKIWVDLLAWRHLERTAPVDGGAAERFRQPLTL